MVGEAEGSVSMGGTEERVKESGGTRFDSFSRGTGVFIREASLSAAGVEGAVSGRRRDPHSLKGGKKFGSKASRAVFNVSAPKTLSDDPPPSRYRVCRG